MQGRLLAILLVAASAVFPALTLSEEAAIPPNQDYVNALWIAESGGALKVATADGDILFEIGDASEIRALAVDPRRGRLWTLAAGTLRAHGFDGSLQSETSVPIVEDDDKHFGLVVDDSTGNVWLGHHSQLYRFSTSGTLERTVPIGSILVGLTYDPEGQRLWVAAGHKLASYDAEGQLATTVELGKAIPQAVEHDPYLKELWVATRDRLLRYSPEGVQTFSASFRKVEHLAADNQGGLWFATDRVLRRTDRSGTVLFEMEPFRGGEPSTMVDLVADPADLSAWVSTAKEIARIDADGVLRNNVDLRGRASFGRIRAIALYADTIAPELVITAPPADAFTNDTQPVFEFAHSDIGIGVDTDSFILLANYDPLEATCSWTAETGSCVPTRPLPDGDYSIDTTVADHAGNVSDAATVSFTVDTIPPVITVRSPDNGSYTNQVNQTIRGSVNESATVSINGNAVTLDIDHAFTSSATLVEGNNTFAIDAVDRAGNVGYLNISVTLDTIPPAPANLSAITVIYDSDKAEVTGAAGSVEPGSLVTVTNTRTGEGITVTADASGGFSAIVDATAGDQLTIQVADRAGNTNGELALPSGDRTTPIPNFTPHDPAAVAPELDPTAPTTVFSATEFLYSGENRIQFGVEPETIEARRVAVLRGKVLTRDNEPLSGVTLTVLYHPEFGWTGTREDGVFDIVVNGGGNLTVNYEKPGYLPVQRKIDAPWEDYVWLPDVVMIPVDTRVTTVDLSAADPIQTARGNPVTDEDGTRQATLLFPKGIQAQMVLPDGTTQSLDTLNVRATEYTVGPEGPKMMPGELPPTTGYTYAVELSVDEAIAARAKEVRFDRPVPFYLDNFLDFPVGGAVPAGWYDREKAAWIPSKNGRIVKVLSITGGLAELDVDGSDKPADATALAALGITEDERRELATLYVPGKSLWRTPVEHFTPWDCNWPYAPPEDSEPPPPDEPELDNEDDPDEPSECEGCVIEAENLVLGESIPIAGTPYTLNYRSNRVPGHTPSRTVEIPLSGSEVPRSLRRIDLEIQVAGQVHRQSFPAAPDLHTTFVWDGKDGMGRPVQGTVELTYQLRFVYQVVYTTPGRFASAFGGAGTGVGIGGNRTAGEVDFSRKHTVVVMADLGGSQVGRWSLTPHHTYSVAGVTLYKGDGSRSTAEVETPNVITTVAGNGSYGFLGDGGPATAARLSIPQGIAVGPDGSLYFADRVNHRVRRVAPDGVIATVAGSGTPRYLTGGSDGGFSGDGGPATEARLNDPWDVALGPDGSFYIADYSNHRIRRVGPDGIITTVAGTGSYGYSGDGGPATEARLFLPVSVAVANDGSIYIADSANDRIRRVGPDGIITTVAGTNITGFSGDGGPAIAASLSSPKGIDLGPDGSLYITDSHNQRIRRVGPDGIITTVAGKGTFGYGGDGGPATEARFGFPRDVASGSDGSAYVADTNNHRIRWVGPNGFIDTVAGTGAYGYSGDGGPAIEAQISGAEGVAIGPDGSLYISDFHNYRIRRVTPPTRLLAWGELRVSSADNGEYYVFNSEGQHLRTLDSVTGALRHGFSYDAQGYLIGLEDGDGNRTIIERDSSGKPLAIIAPHGQRTELTVDANGNLTAVTNPAGETHAMTYTPEGLLTGVKKPSGAQYSYEYDSIGRLIRDRDPVGGGWTLARTETENGYEARMTSAEGSTSRFGVERLSETEILRTTVAPDGTVATRHITTTDKDITEEAIDADGTRRTQHQSPDPLDGMDAPYVDAATITTPAGLTQSASATRDATLADPNDPLSLTALSETTTINGSTSTAKYQSATRTWTTTSAEGRSSIEVLNAKGRPILTRFADLAAASYDYDSRGRLKTLSEGGADDARTAAFTYDALGNLETVTDALGRTTRFDYDLAGRVTKQTLPDGRTIGYHYDPNGNLTALTPPGKEAHLFAYTPVDLEEQYTPPDLDGVETLTRYTYNKDKVASSVRTAAPSTTPTTAGAGSRRSPTRKAGSNTSTTRPAANWQASCVPTVIASTTPTTASCRLPRRPLAK